MADSIGFASNFKLPEVKLYAHRDIITQGDYYLRHIEAMTREGLHDKGDIAAELAHRDERIVALERELTQAVQIYTDAAGERDKALSDLAAAQADRDTALTDTHDRIADLEAEAAALRVLLGSVVKRKISYWWDGEKQCHVPWVMVEFAAVASGEPNTAQGWRDRDAFAAAIDQARGGGNG